MLPTDEQVLTIAEKTIAEKLTATPTAIEAYWDGDSSGWFINLVAVIPDRRPAVQQDPAGSQAAYRDHFLTSLQGDGGDMRLFNSQVPPWPESVRAREIGERLAARFGVPFYFPSPDRPELDTPRWWQQHLATHCRRCGLPLLQQEHCPWRGVCYDCHRAEEREIKARLAASGEAPHSPSA